MKEIWIRENGEAKIFYAVGGDLPGMALGVPPGIHDLHLEARRENENFENNGSNRKVGLSIDGPHNLDGRTIFYAWKVYSTKVILPEE